MQAVALVVFIHIVGQVTKLLVITAPGHKYYLSFCYYRVSSPGTAAQSTDSVKPMEAPSLVQTKFRKSSNTWTRACHATHLDLKSRRHPPRHSDPRPQLLHQA